MKSTSEIMLLAGTMVYKLYCFSEEEIGIVENS